MCIYVHSKRREKDEKQKQKELDSIFPLFHFVLEEQKAKEKKYAFHGSIFKDVSFQNKVIIMVKITAWGSMQVNPNPI